MASPTDPNLVIDIETDEFMQLRPYQSEFVARITQRDAPIEGCRGFMIFNTPGNELSRSAEATAQSMRKLTGVLEVTGDMIWGIPVGKKKHWLRRELKRIQYDADRKLEQLESEIFYDNL